MATVEEHGRIVLSGVIPNRIDLLDNVLRELTIDHFSDPSQKIFFKFLETYFQTTGGVVSKVALGDLLGKFSVVDVGRQALLEELYESFKHANVDDSDFLWSVHELQEEYKASKLRDALTNTMEILQKGVELKSGETLKGPEQAKEFLAEAVAEIDGPLGAHDTPHGNMRDESALILSEYREVKQARADGHLSGVQFGITDLDEKVQGLQRGDLALTAAYTNDGKTTLCVQMAWSAAIEQGKNVLFLSTETVNSVVRRRLIARHSKHPKFLEHGLPEGLNSKDLKAGTLNPHEEEFFDIVRNDFTDRSNEYGEMYIHQVPRFATMDQVEHIMYSTQRMFDIDLVVCDYVQLLRPIGSRNTDRESLSGVIKNSKQVAVSFNKGRGVPFVSPWQVSRAAKEQADQTGRYASQALAETAEATNTPDIIVSILAPVDNTERYANLTAQVLKHRDGETADGIQLTVDYATCAFSSRGSFESLSSPSYSGAGSLNDLLS